jgi:hypothetical protein
MNLGLQILLDAVRTVVAAIWRKRAFALVAFLANWACQRLSPTGWAGAVLNDAFHLVEHEASRLGWSLLAALALLAVLLIAEVAAERRSGGFHRGWVVDAARWAVTWHLIPSMATVCASVFGVCAAFGLDGALFGGAFLFWMGVNLTVVQAFVGFAGMRRAH